MSNHIHNHQIVGMLNHILMSYFQNKAQDFGVDFYNTRPTESITKSLIGHYFVPDVDYAYMKHFHMGKIHVENITLDKLKNLQIEDFLDKEFKTKINDLAKDFAEIAQQYPYSDYVFSNLPDAFPYISAVDRDCESNFCARTIYGHDFLKNEAQIIFEFYCLIVQRFRKVIDGENVIMSPVEFMTPEDREKYDKQP